MYRCGMKALRIWYRISKFFIYSYRHRGKRNKSYHVVFVVNCYNFSGLDPKEEKKMVNLSVSKKWKELFSLAKENLSWIIRLTFLLLLFRYPIFGIFFLSSGTFFSHIFIQRNFILFILEPFIGGEEICVRGLSFSSTRRARKFRLFIVFPTTNVR